MFICGNPLFGQSWMYMLICSLIIAISARTTDGLEVTQAMVKQLATEFFDFKIQENPDIARAYGINKYQFLTEEWNKAAFDRRINKSEMFLSKVKDYMSNYVVDAEDRLTLEIMEHSLTKFLEGSEFMNYTRTLNVDLADLVIKADLRNFLDDEDELYYWQKQILSYQQVFKDQLALLDEGIASGLTPARPICEDVLRKYKDAVGESLDGFFAFRPFMTVGADMGSDSVYPRARENCQILRRRMLQFVSKFETEYLPVCRDSNHSSASSLPGGDKYYEAALRHYTADYVTPEYAHTLGLKEVKRITTDMKRIISNEGFNGSIGEYVEYLLTIPDETFSTSEELRHGYIHMLNDRIRPKLHSEFDDESPIGLDIIDHPVGSLGVYAAPMWTKNGWTKGIFAYDGSKPREILKIVMLPIMIHEGVPGHHYQYSKMLSEGSIPDFRRYVDSSHKAQSPFNFPSYTVYTEGWALYSEYLSEQMGILQTEKERFGKLSMESLRAARLVVDTGIHYYNWTMQEAADYLKENTALSNSSCWVQVERYVTWPGQSCSYKIGELKIREIRSKAENELEEHFDAAQFHNALLDLGPLPMEIMEREMIKWIQSQKRLPVSSAIFKYWSGIVILTTLAMSTQLA